MSEMRLAFMTWVCPEWSVQQIIEGAHRHGYQGVELRVGSGHKHGVEKETSEEEARRVGLAFREQGLEVCAIAASCSFASADGDERGRQVQDLKAYIALAHALGCGRVRIFGGQFPPAIEPAAVIDYVADAISESLETAQEARVQVLVETHDSFSHTPYARELMSQLYSEYAGIVWDLAHPLRHFERVEDTYDNIAGFVKHAHVHDFMYSEDRSSIRIVPFGAGVVPHQRVLALLAGSGYNGYLSVEVMEGDADQVLADYAGGLRRLLGREEPAAG